MTVLASASFAQRLNLLSFAILVGLPLGAQAQQAAFTDSEGARELDTIVVVGKAVRGLERRHKDNVATKTTLPIAETPQAVAVITREQMDAQAVGRVSEALRYSAGVMPESDGMDARFDSWAVRGFYAGNTAWRDGIRLDGGSGAGNNWTIPQVERFFLERIDVLKGPSSVMYGQVVPGGAVMLSSKRPQFASNGQAQLRFRAPAGMQLAADLEGTGEGATSGWRVAALADQGDTQVDGVKRKRLAVAPSLRWKVGEAGGFTLMAEAQRDRGGSDYQWLPAYGTLFPNPEGMLKPSAYLGDHGFDRFDRDQASVGWTFNNAFTDSFSLEHNARWMRVHTEMEMIQSDMYAVADPQTSPDWDWRSIDRYASRGVGTSRSLGLDTRLRKKFAGEGWSQEWLLGIDYYRNAFEGQRDSADIINGLSRIDMYAPDQGVVLSDFAPLSSIDSTKSQFGTYLQGQLVAGGWRVLAGLRHDRARMETSTRRGSGAWSTTEQRPAATTGRVGLLYRFDNGLAPYASWSSSFEPVGGATFAGKAFEPMTARQQEVGIKFAPDDERWYATAAAFEVLQRNRLTDDPVNGWPEQVQTGEVRVRGWELELKARPWRDGSIDATYARLATEVTRSEIPEELGHPLTYVPRERAAVWVSQRAGSLTLGLGARYTGVSYGNDIGLDRGYGGLRIPGYTLLDAQLLWRGLGNAGSDTSLALNIGNLRDKRYITGCGSVWTCGYGYGRQFTVTLDHRW